MAKPIPVFSFVFAAYAATSSVEIATRPPPIRKVVRFDPFLKAWREKTPGGVMFAKVSVMRDDASRSSASSSPASEAFEEMWLGEIAETRLGFVGVAMGDQRLPTHISVGQRIRFHGINVRDWRAGDAADAGVAPKALDRLRPPRETLASLIEIVGA